MRKAYKIVDVENGVISELSLQWIMNQFSLFIQNHARMRESIIMYLRQTVCHDFYPLSIVDGNGMAYIVATGKENDRVAAMGAYISIAMGRSMALMEVTNQKALPPKIALSIKKYDEAIEQQIQESLQ